MGQPKVVRFGLFEVDIAAGELRKRGIKIKLQEQPFRILEKLVERPGEVVTRDELKQALWPDDIHVDFDHSLNRAVNRLRAAVGDSSSTPNYIETLPRRGYRFIGQVQPPESAGPQTPPAASARQTPLRRTSRRKIAAGLSAAGLLTFGLIAGLWLDTTEPVPAPPLRRFAFMHDAPILHSVVSPDGSRLVYNTRHSGDRALGNLFVQDLDQETPRMIEGVQGAWHLFWSPDGRSIGFQDIDGTLKTVSLNGGPVTTVCQMPGAIRGRVYGATWSPSAETIVFASGDPAALYEVPARGGTPVLLLQPHAREAALDRMHPHFLPGDAEDRVLLFSKGTFASDAEVVVRDLSSGVEHTLARGHYPAYSPTGHILYQEQYFSSEIWALPFSRNLPGVAADPFLVTEVGFRPSAASDGTLVYRDDSEDQQQLVWRDRQGNRLGELGRPLKALVYPALSPDDRYVAVEASLFGPRDIWVFDLERSINFRFTSHPADDTRALWIGSREMLSFSSNRDGNYDVFVRPLDRSTEARPISRDERDEYNDDWSPDGRRLLYGMSGKGTDADIWQIDTGPSSGETERSVLLQTAFRETGGRFSPDGEYFAYCSKESGRENVYVRAFSASGPGIMVSPDGGAQPRWGPDGELFYVQGDTLMATSVQTSPRITAGAPTALFSDPQLISRWTAATYDVTRDGQRFILVETLGGHKAFVTRVVQNWFGEFREADLDVLPRKPE